MYLLDTNTVSYFITGRSPAVREAYFKAEQQSTIAISTITEAELRFGLRKRSIGAVLSQHFESFFSTITVLPWDSAAARAYAELRSRLAQAGKSLATLDLLIAAHALSVNTVLVTHDGAFKHAAPMLQIEDWATDL